MFYQTKKTSSTILNLKLYYFVVDILIFLNVRPLHITGNIIVGDRDHCTGTLSNITQGLTDHFDMDSLVYVILPGNNLFCPSTPVFKDLFSKWQIVIKDPRTDVPDNDTFTVLPDVYIIFINDYHNVQQLQDLLSYLELNEYSWNPRAKFLLLTNRNVLFSQSRKVDMVFETFNFLWQRNALRAALILAENGGEAITLFSSSPFSKTYHTCKKISSSTQLQEIPLKNGDLSGLIIDGYLFKSPRNFLGCPLIAYTFPFPPYSIPKQNKNGTDMNLVYETGIEVKLVNLFAEVYKLSVNIGTSDYIDSNGWTKTLPNGTSVGMYHDLRNYKIDLAFAGGIPLLPYELDYVSAYVFSSLSWYVPNPSFIPTWQLITTTFMYSTWLVLILVFVFFLLLYNLMRRVISCNRTEENVSLVMIAACLGVSYPGSPKLSHLRIMLFSWLLIETIDDLENSELKTCVSKVFIDNYLERTEGTFKNLFENAMVCNNIEDTVKIFIKNRNISVLAKDNYMNFILDEKQARIHKVDPKFLTFPVAMPLSKGNALVEPLRKLILNVTEFGFTHKWMSDLQNEEKNKIIFDDRTTLDSKNIVLQKEDFVWLYKLFLLGDVIAVLVFGFEVCLSGLKKRYF